jgi:hypothetical protein
MVQHRQPRAFDPTRASLIPFDPNVEFFSMSACIDITKYEYLQGYYSLYQTQGCAYTLKLYGINVFDEYDIYPPSVEIYPVVDLPRYAYEVNHD